MNILIRFRLQNLFIHSYILIQLSAQLFASALNYCIYSYISGRVHFGPNNLCRRASVLSWFQVNFD